MDKEIAVTGVNTATEELILAEKFAVSEADQIARRIESCIDKGADKVVIVLPCGAVFDRNVKKLNEISLSVFVNQIFRTLGAA